LEWFLYEDKLFEIGDFIHPGGQFLMELIRSKDITKNVEGIEPLIFYDKISRNFKFS